MWRCEVIEHDQVADAANTAIHLEGCEDALLNKFRPALAANGCDLATYSSSSAIIGPLSGAPFAVAVMGKGNGVASPTKPSATTKKPS